MTGRSIEALVERGDTCGEELYLGAADRTAGIARQIPDLRDFHVLNRKGIRELYTKVDNLRI